MPLCIPDKWSCTLQRLQTNTGPLVLFEIAEATYTVGAASDQWMRVVTTPPTSPAGGVAARDDCPHLGGGSNRVVLDA